MNISLKKVIIDSSDEKVIIVPVDLPKGSSIEQEESWESFCIRYAAGDWNSRHQSTPPPSLKEFYIKTDELIPISDEVNTLKDLSGYQDFIPAPQNPQAVYDVSYSILTLHRFMFESGWLIVYFSFVCGVDLFNLSLLLLHSYSRRLII